MGLQVKICGLARARDVEAAVRAGADALGFVFWPGSPRAVRPADVARWTAGLERRILRVGVFVDAEPGAVRRAREEAGLDVAQLHGRETPAVGARVGGRLWRVCRAAAPPEEAAWIAAGLEAWVADAPAGTMPGGTGRPADWAAAAGLVGRAARPVVLAGGLTPENVVEAVRRVQPWGVDVSSGVESAPGRKDADRMRIFVEQCRNA